MPARKQLRAANKIITCPINFPLMESNYNISEPQKFLLDNQLAKSRNPPPPLYKERDGYFVLGPGDVKNRIKCLKGNWFEERFKQELELQTSLNEEDLGYETSNELKLNHKSQENESNLEFPGIASKPYTWATFSLHCDQINKEITTNEEDKKLLDTKDLKHIDGKVSSVTSMDEVVYFGNKIQLFTNKNQFLTSDFYTQSTSYSSQFTEYNHLRQEKANSTTTQKINGLHKLNAAEFVLFTEPTMGKNVEIPLLNRNTFEIRSCEGEKVSGQELHYGEKFRLVLNISNVEFFVKSVTNSVSNFSEFNGQQSVTITRHPNGNDTIWTILEPITSIRRSSLSFNKQIQYENNDQNYSKTKNCQKKVLKNSKVLIKHCQTNTFLNDLKKNKTYLFGTFSNVGCGLAIANYKLNSEDWLWNLKTVQEGKKNIIGH
ncbi:hypothetical protein HDU92_001647 [Lobulomyces angularis]|nr:hypothetical protein HDU92_001647 [Lobulomyces angularis]